MDYFKPYSIAADETILAAWDSQVAKVESDTQLAKSLAAQSADLFPRFAARYAELRALPRGARRSLQRRIARSGELGESSPERLQGRAGNAAPSKLASSLAGAALFLALARGAAPAATINVDTDVPTVAADGLCSLVEAIINANDDAASHADCASGAGADTIMLLSTATHTIVKNYGAGTYGATRLPEVTSDITIEGNGSTITRQAQGKLSRLIAVEETGILTLKNTIVTGGRSTQGGGIFNAGSLVIYGSTISTNSATKAGGGVFNRGTAALTNGSVITENTAYKGGGVHNGSELTIDGSTISDNTAGRLGGGIHNNDTITITNSVITGNKAEYGGGLFINDRDEATIDNTTISNNRALGRARSGGGGIFNDDATLNVANSDITGNKSRSGAGVFNDGRFHLDDSTVTDNAATYRCGGIFNNRPDTTIKGGSTTISGNHAPRFPNNCSL
jgi:hypothetical protein